LKKGGKKGYTRCKPEHDLRVGWSKKVRGKKLREGWKRLESLKEKK